MSGPDRPAEDLPNRTAIGRRPRGNMQRSNTGDLSGFGATDSDCSEYTGRKLFCSMGFRIGGSRQVDYGLSLNQGFRVTDAELVVQRRQKVLHVADFDAAADFYLPE